MAEREQIPFDVLFVGGGPACLAGAIHLARLAAEKGLDLTIGLIEKGAEAGDHSLSGAMLDPVALAELFPDYIKRGCPIQTGESADALYFLTKASQFKVPVFPGFLSSRGCFAVSISQFVRWLASEAEALGVNVFCGFSGSGVLFGPGETSVAGVRAGDKGVARDGSRKANFSPGPDLLAKITVFGEGPKGSLAREVDRKLAIYPPSMPQTFETAVKEVLALDPGAPFLSGPATALYTLGYPVSVASRGGGFLYRMGTDKASIGYVLGLDYTDPQTDPHALFLAFKRHPFIARLLEGHQVLEHGARTLCAGGWHTMPRLAVDGALFVGETASMLNPMRLKGIHTAMKSGMLAAEACLHALQSGDFSQETLSGYERGVRESWLGRELCAARNFSQAMAKEPVARILHLAAQTLTKGKGLRDPLPMQSDWKHMRKVPENVPRPAELGPDPEKATGVFLSGTRHDEDQPCHLAIRDPELCAGVCYENFRSPCTRFCPGAVYEMREESPGKRRLVLNPSNCLHCKTCEIKDPYQNILWNPPEGGSGPSHRIM